MATTSANAVTSLHRSGAEAAKTIGPMIGSSLKRIKRGAAGLDIKVTTADNTYTGKSGSKRD